MTDTDTAQDTAAENANAKPSRSDNVNLSTISDIPVEVTAVLGSAKMEVSRLLELSRGSVVRLDRKVGEPIDIMVNNRLIARGEIVIVENKIGITMTEIFGGDSVG